MSMFDYPLNLRFKLIALAPRIIVADNKMKEVLYVSQKVLKLREDIRIYNNQDQEREIYNIQAEKILDFNTRYNFFRSDTRDHIGSVKAKGWRSIWSATYMIDDPFEKQMMFIKEDNPWVKIADSIIDGIPVIGMFSGYFLHPSYTAYRSKNLGDQSQAVMRITKKPAFFESSFSIELLDPDIDRDQELSALLSFMLMVQFMRRRG